MPKIGSDGTNAQAFMNYPKDWYEAYIKGATVKNTRQTGGLMAEIDWKPDDTQDAKANPGTIREWVMIDGADPQGVPYRTDNWFQHLDALDIKRDYTCCKQIGSKQHFVVKKETGKYHCPHCGAASPRVMVDSNEDNTLPWNGMRARIQVDIRKIPNSDEERNRIQRVVALTK